MIKSYNDWLKTLIFEQVWKSDSYELTIADIFRGYGTLSYSDTQTSPNSAIKQIQNKIISKLSENDKTKKWIVDHKYKADNSFGKNTADALGLVLNKSFKDPTTLKIGPKTLALLGFKEPEKYSTDITLVALTLSVETGESGEEEMKAIANVIANRSFIRKMTILDVILRDSQFSLWNPYQGKSNEDMVSSALKYWRPENSTTWPNAVKYAKLLINKSKFVDNTNGATHYYNPKVVVPHWAKATTWKSHNLSFVHDFGRETSTHWAKKPIVRS